MHGPTNVKAICACACLHVWPGIAKTKALTFALIKKTANSRCMTHGTYFVPTIRLWQSVIQYILVRMLPLCGDRPVTVKWWWGSSLVWKVWPVKIAAEICHLSVLVVLFRSPQFRVPEVHKSQASGCRTVASNICAASVWNLLHVPILAPTILRWMLDLKKITPMRYTLIILQFDAN